MTGEGEIGVERPSGYVVTSPGKAVKSSTISVGASRIVDKPPCVSCSS